MTCPICEKSFRTEISYEEHIESHKNTHDRNYPVSNIDNKVNSVETRTLNTRKIFGVEKFDNLSDKKLKDIQDIDELISKRTFVGQVKKIIAKYPFLYLPNFIGEFMRGEPSKKLREKYSFSNLDLKYICKVLKLDKTIYTLTRHDNPFIMNLKIHSWKEKYQTIIESCDFFKEEIDSIIFDNILRSYIILIMIDNTEKGIKKEDIISNSRTITVNYDIFKFVDKRLEHSFQSMFSNGYENRITTIVDELVYEKIIQRKIGDPQSLVTDLSIDKVKKHIINELELDPVYQKESVIKRDLMAKYPILKLITSRNIIDIALWELKSEKHVRIERRTNFKNSRIISLTKDHYNAEEKLKFMNDKPLKFYGRKVTPDRFIDELLELEQGDFDDKDDQVTRLVGLVNSAKLLSPHKDIPEFHFSINIKDYKFKQEQLDAMSKLDFTISSNLFHCKVILNGILSLDKYEKLKELIPENEQGIIFTFKKVPKAVQQKITTDRTIQVINEEGVKLWVSITPI